MILSSLCLFCKSNGQGYHSNYPNSCFFFVFCFYFCTSFLFHCDQIVKKRISLREEGCLLAYSWRKDGIHRGTGKWWQNQETSCHIALPLQLGSTYIMYRKSHWAANIKAWLQPCTSPRQGKAPKVPTVFINSTTNWGPSVQTHQSTGGHTSCSSHTWLQFFKSFYWLVIKRRETKLCWLPKKNIYIYVFLS